MVKKNVNFTVKDNWYVNQWIWKDFQKCNQYLLMLLKDLGVDYQVISITKTE